MSNDCDCNKIIGPGDDDYGRDNMIVDWICPQCKGITKMTQLEKRMIAGVAPHTCKLCGWKNELGKQIREIIEGAAKNIKEGNHNV